MERTLYAVQSMNLSLVDSQNGGFLGQGPGAAQHSGEIERVVGEEQLEILKRCYDEAKRMVSERRAVLDRMAERLLEREKLEERDIVEILGPRPAEV